MTNADMIAQDGTGVVFMIALVLFFIMCKIAENKR
mgnify:CR=1 FL=1